MCHFVFVEVNGAESAYPGGVDDGAALLARQPEKLAEGGGVHAGVVYGRDVGCLEVEAGNEVVDECGLPYAGVARYEGNLAGEDFSKLVDALAGLGRDKRYLIAYGAVEVGKGVEQGAVIVVGEQVCLVYGNQGRNAVGCGCGEETVDECGGGGGVGKCNHEHCKVDIGGYDV